MSENIYVSPVQAVEGLSSINIDQSSIPRFEIARYISLASEIKKADFDESIQFVLTRHFLENKTGFEKFKYLCGVLTNLRRSYLVPSN